MAGLRVHISPWIHPVPAPRPLPIHILGHFREIIPYFLAFFKPAVEPET